ncbi:G2/mitotic-specific cyclin-B3 [Trichinella zimbabwensis]|uniref:G2/mitotic-specific cyclin-B3 n=1 Tax=Trichinella zimbabwensis TaxID=268475 RepID=A0A0V1HAP8_9BILA|nr:G2/mitotic-specific cyclin-B3 [Trichinella zimbabwensis]
MDIEYVEEELDTSISENEENNSLNVGSSIEDVIISKNKRSISRISLDQESLEESIEMDTSSSLSYDSFNSDTSVSDPYDQDAFNYYRLREEKFMIGDYWPNQKHMTPPMRSILVHWMFETFDAYSFPTEAFFHSVKLFDLYLEKNCVEKKQLQLISIVTLLIASKFDNRNEILMNEISYISHNAYEMEEVIMKEREILVYFNFDISFPTAIHFLHHFAKGTFCDKLTYLLSRYILEMSMLSYELVNVKDSIRAAASLFLALKIKQLEWTELHLKVSGYKEADLIVTMFKLNAVVKSKSINRYCSTIKQKYKTKINLDVFESPDIPKNTKTEEND